MFPECLLGGGGNDCLKKEKKEKWRLQGFI